MKPPEELVRLGRLFRQKGGRVYAVGGWVRDGLLGREQGDLDLACNATPRQLEEMGLELRERSAGLASYTLIWENRIAELTCFRRESCRRDGVHRPQRVETGVTLQEDALRRDFTVNALYMELETGELLDPTGGMKDLAAQRLVTPREPEAVFSEDALRILRLARFWAKLDMEPEEGTLSAAQKQVGLLDSLESSRIGTELKAILPLKTGALRLEQLGVWQVLWPGICLDPEICGRVDRLRPDSVLRMAAVLWYGGVTCAQDRLMGLGWSRQEARRVEGLLQKRPQERLDFKELLASPLGADWVALHGEGAEFLAEHLPASPEQLPLSGGEIMALLHREPGPWLGMVKKRLWRAVLADPAQNDREKLIEKVLHEDDF